MFIFYVSAGTCEEPLSSLEIFKNLSHFQEIKIKSKKFMDYRECVDSAATLIQDIISELNSNGGSFSSFVDENPNFHKEEDSPYDHIAGVGMLEQWGENELIRYYLIDTNTKDLTTGSYLTQLVISILSVEINH